MASHHQSDSADLKVEILDVYNAICDAFADLDFDTVLGYFADHGMVKISQGRLFRGKQELAENWRQRIGGVGALRIRIENVELRRIDGQHVWTTADEYISADGVERRAVVSNIFVLQESGWKILLDHTSYCEEES